MKAISLWQPWASLIAVKGSPDPAIAVLGKGNETRSKRWEYRGPLAIHSAGVRNPYMINALIWPPFREALEAIGIRRVEDYPLGAFLAVCDKVDCVEVTWDNKPPEPEVLFGDYTVGRFFYPLANIRVLPEPIPAKGKQGPWVPEADVLEQLEEFYYGPLSETAKQVMEAAATGKGVRCGSLYYNAARHLEERGLVKPIGIGTWEITDKGRQYWTKLQGA